MLTAAAAGLVFVLVVAAAWRFARTLREREPEPVVTPTPLPASTDEEFVATLERLDQEALLEKLDVVEHLDFLKGLSAADLDVASTFGFEDEVLQELDEWTANDADDAEDPEEKGG